MTTPAAVEKAQLLMDNLKDISADSLEAVSEEKANIPQVIDNTNVDLDVSVASQVLVDRSFGPALTTSSSTDSPAPVALTFKQHEQPQEDLSLMKETSAKQPLEVSLTQEQRQYPLPLEPQQQHHHQQPQQQEQEGGKLKFPSLLFGGGKIPGWPHFVKGCLAHWPILYECAFKRASTGCVRAIGP